LLAMRNRAVSSMTAIIIIITTFDALTSLAAT
jgi:hypothetical protein